MQAYQKTKTKLIWFIRLLRADLSKMKKFTTLKICRKKGREKRKKRKKTSNSKTQKNRGKGKKRLITTELKYKKLV